MPHYTDYLYSNTEAYNAKRLFSPKVEVFIKSKDENDDFSISEALGTGENYDLVNQKPTGLKSVEFSLNEGFDSGTCTINLYDRNREYANLLYNFDEGEPIEVEETTEIVTTTTTVNTPTTSNTSSKYEPDPSYTKRERAWLDMIAWAEGTFEYNEQNGYNIIFTFKTFSSYKDHPRIRIRSGSLVSSAAGRYQFLDTTWDDFARRFGYKSFQPKNQDDAALRYTADGHPLSTIRNSNARTDVNAGRIETAINKCNGIWASFPGSPYGQPVKTMAQMLRFYESRYDYYCNVNSAQTTAKESVTQTPITIKKVKDSLRNRLVGAVIYITITLDRPTAVNPVSVTYVFIETGMGYDSGSSEVIIYGKASSFPFNQKILNTAYTNLSLFDLFKRFTDRQGLTLEMEDDGIEYEYFPVIGKTLWKALVEEARRRGYFVTFKRNDVDGLQDFIGSNLSVFLPASANQDTDVYEIVHGFNAPNNLQFDYRIEETNETVYDEKNRTNKIEAAAEINPLTGTYEDKAITKVFTNFPEEQEPDTEDKTLDGTSMGGNEPVYKDQDRDSQLQVDALNRANLVRLNGITMTCRMPMDENLIKLLPNNYVQTSGYEVVRNTSAPERRRNIEDPGVKSGLNRIFVINGIRHSISAEGFETSIDAKSPIKSQYKLF